MDNNNKNLAASIKPPIKGLINNENKLNPEMCSKLKSPKTKQLPAFMNPTISASIKASGPKRKILGERNETLETLEQSSLGSSVVDSDGESSLQPYDPVKNYLSPRPKYLRYNPDRRRKVLGLLENDAGRVDRVEISACFDSVEDSCSVQESVEDSCTERESDEEADDVSDEECESEYEYEDEDEDEDEWFRLKGVFKFVLAVIAAILTAHAICLMKCPTDSESLDWSGRVYGLNVSDVGYGSVMEPVFLKEDVFKIDEVFVHPENDDSNVIEEENIEEFVEVQNVKTDEVFVHLDEAENDDSNTIEDESIEELVELQNAKDEAENDDLNVVEEAVDDVNQSEQTDEAENDDSNVIQDEAVDDIIEEDAADANDIELANEMENGLDDNKTNDSLIKFTTFDLTVAVLVAHVLILTSLGAVFVSRRKKVEKKEFKNIEKEEQFVTKEASLPLPPLQNDIISHVHNIPSVELLGEFVFGEEVTSSISSTISSRMQMSTGDSHTVKKPRRKTAEVAVTPSPVSVRRSSRLKTRASVMSP